MDLVKIRAWLIIIAIIAVIVFYCWKKMPSSHAELIQELDDFFRDRTPLDDEDFYVQYFQKQGVPREIPIRVRQIFAEQFGADFSRITNADDFSEEMKFIWGFDSMIDVEILVEIEKEFGITIPDKVAEEMTSIQKIIDAVWELKK